MMNKKLILLIVMIGLLMLASIAQAQTDGDSDGDGLSDSIDACPFEPGPRENNGCPIEEEEPPRPPIESSFGGESVTDSTPAPQDDDLGDDVEETPTFQLIPLSLDGICVASPDGNFNVNVRQYPTLASDVIGILGVNQTAPVVNVIQVMFQAEPERVSLEEDTVWYQINVGGVLGWVGLSVVRLGGDCSDFVIPFVADDILTPNSGPLGAVYLKLDGIDGEADESSDLLVFDWSEKPDGGLLLHPYGLQNIALDMIDGHVLVNDDDGLLLLDVLVGNPDEEAIPMLDLDILFCNFAQDPITSADCIVIRPLNATATAQPAVLLCVVDRDGNTSCDWAEEQTDTTGTDCTPVGGTLFCATDYVPEAGCAYNDDAILVCNIDSVHITPLDPQSPLPGLGILKPVSGSVSLLLPAVQH